MFRDMETERLRVVLDFFKFVLGTVLLGVIAAAISYSLKSREASLKEREGERLEFELMGKYVEFALTDNVATRERFARYFWRVSRASDTKQGWELYLNDVMKEKAEAESKRDALAAQTKELERLVASDKAKAAELQEVRRKLKEVMDQLEVRRSAVAPGVVLQGQGRGSGLGGSASASSTGSATLSVSPSSER